MMSFALLTAGEAAVQRRRRDARQRVGNPEPPDDRPLFRDDAYLTEADRHGHRAGAGGIELDRTLFYASSGGRPGDSRPIGALRSPGPSTRTGPSPRPAPYSRRRAAGAGAPVTLRLDWARRHRLMRMHSACTSSRWCCPSASPAGDRRGQGAARLRHARAARGRGRARGAAQRLRRRRPAGQRGMDQRGRARGAAGDGQDDEGEAARRPGPGAADPHRRRRRHARPAALRRHPRALDRPRSAGSGSARSRRRAARTAASTCTSPTEPCEGPMALYRRRVAEGALDADPAQRLAVEKLQLLAMRLADYNPARPKRVGLGRFGWGRDRLEEKVVPGPLPLRRRRARQVDADGPVLRRRAGRAEAAGAFPRLHAGDARWHRRGARRRARPTRCARSPTRWRTRRRCSASTRCRSPTSPTRCWSGGCSSGCSSAASWWSTTSNRPPDELYKDGLNRQLFLPFIALIKERLEVHELESATDHRLDRLAGRAGLPYAARAGGDRGARRRLGASWRRARRAADADGAGPRR